MNKYLLNLFKQFIKSTGIENFDYTDYNHQQLFISWITQLKKTTREYQEYLQYLGINIDDASTCEINKGKYDSVSLLSTKVISQFGESLKKENQEICMFQGEPLILTGSKIIRGQVADTYITHNPFDFINMDVFNYFYHHNKGICIGVYGQNYDFDKNSKIHQLKLIKNMISTNLNESYDTYNDTYLYTIYGTKHPKIRTRILTRL